MFYTNLIPLIFKHLYIFNFRTICVFPKCCIFVINLLFLEKTSSVTGFSEKSRDEKCSFEEAASFEKIKAASSRAIKNNVIFFISFKYTAKGRKGKKNYKNLFDKSTRVN